MRWKKELKLAPGYLILTLWILFTLALLGWVLLASFSTTKEIFSNKLLDSGFHIENYVKAWVNSNVSTIFFNSLFYAAVSCTLPVSYTHLDVYKRQGQAVPVSQWELTGASMPEGFCSGSEFKGVFEGAGDTADAGNAADAGNTAETKKAEAVSAPMRVVLEHASPFHEYTVSFLAYAVWDPTQMYNHITNNWGDKPHEIPFDVRQEASGLFAREYLVQW